MDPSYRKSCKKYKPSELVSDNVVGWFDTQLALVSWKCPYSHSCLMDSQQFLHAAAAESDPAGFMLMYIFFQKSSIFALLQSISVVK